MVCTSSKFRSGRSGRELAGSIAIGAAAGVTTAVGVLVGRKAATQAKVGKGHPSHHDRRAWARRGTLLINSAADRVPPSSR